MATCLVTQPKDILLVQFVERGLIHIGWSMEEMTHLQAIDVFFHAIILLENKKRHSMVSKSFDCLHNHWVERKYYWQSMTFVIYGEKGLDMINPKWLLLIIGKKKFIFFELVYWRYLHVCHNLDVIHIEKNVCESIISTLLNIPRKTKYALNSHLDLMDMGLMRELAPRFEPNWTYPPPACYTLSKIEKKVFCQTLVDLKVPEGIAQTLEILCQWNSWSSIAWNPMIIIH